MILVNYEKGDDGELKPLSVKAVGTGKVNKPGTALVTGGTGGFGNVLIRKAFTVDNVRHFIGPSRNGDTEHMRRIFR